jgi:uncharacterized protein
MKILKQNNISSVLTLFLILLLIIPGTSCKKQKRTAGCEKLEHAGVSEVKLLGETARRRDIQKKYLWRFQTGALRNFEGFLDFERDLLSPWTEHITEKQMLKQVLCAYTGVGKTLSAALCYAASDHDTALEAVKDRYINSIIASQDADGYLGTLLREDDPPIFTRWNLHDGGYMCSALLENYEQFDNDQSLEAARKYMDLVIRSWEKAPSQPGALSPVGITQTFLKLYKITDNPIYLEFFADQPFDGRFIRKESVRSWKQKLIHLNVPSEDSYRANIDAKVHTYRFFLRCIDQLDLNALEPDPGLELMSDYALAKMCDINQPGMFISGATGRHEGWVEDQDGRGAIGEACAVIHQIWWLSRLIEQRNDLSFGDLMERMVLNHMFAAQNSDPEDGRTRYFVPLSGERNYRKGAHCCEGNTRRFWARFPELIYFTGDNCIAVNLFTSSILNTELEGIPVTVKQETQFPLDGNIQIQIDTEKRSKFSIRFRIPQWADSYEIKVNGMPVREYKIKGGVEISRIWRKGDTVQLSLPMKYKWIAGTLFYTGRAALMRGPQVFCVSREQNPQLEDTDISSFTFDASSAKAIEPSGATALRNGQAVSVIGKTEDGNVVEVIFNDFPEINGEETYFRISELAVAQKDELYRTEDIDKYDKIVDSADIKKSSRK